MSNPLDKIVAQVFLEKSLSDFYCKEESCKGWETNIVTQPAAVKNVVHAGAERIAAGFGVPTDLIDRDMAHMIDHTLLKPDATDAEITQLCNEAKQYGFATVCVNPSFVALCARLLKGTRVKVCTVVGFPLGATCTEVKRMEAERAISEGAEEIDMVIHVGKLKSGDFSYVFRDIQQVVIPVKNKRFLTKVILETALLTDEEKIKACLIAKEAGADFVKTSTGFSKGGATVNDVALMKYVVGSTVGVKASGGIRSTEEAKSLIGSGADRIGASASIKIISKA